MKKSYLALLTLIPIVVGWLVNLVITIPVVGVPLFWGLPLAMLFFWFWLGKQFAGTDWSFLQSMAIGNAAGLISLALYIWQFVFETDETRNLFLAGLSQMYGAAAPTYFFGWLARMFESEPNTIGRASFLAIQVIALVLLLAVFLCGYLWQKKEKQGA